jgi:glycosyltransferase involved in cell wall biosynthesis
LNSGGFHLKFTDMNNRLTVIVPCKNEKLNIRQCIESFHAIADEILIADSGSTDGTREIASCFSKVRLIEREYVFSGDFKNWAIPQASHEWVLIVDADERVTPELADEIKNVLAGAPDRDGYWIRRNNHLFGYRLHYGDARTDTVMRLFKKDLGRYTGPSDHGEVVISTGRVGCLKCCFDHFAVWDYDTYFRKFHRYTTFQAQQWHAAGRDTSYFKLLVRPMFRFFREWILQGSILDGKLGLHTAWMAAMYAFMKQARLWEMNHALSPPNPDPAFQPHGAGGFEAGVPLSVSDRESNAPFETDLGLESRLPLKHEQSAAA